MGERFEAERCVALNLSLPPVESIHAAQEALLQYQSSFRVELTAQFPSPYPPPWRAPGVLTESRVWFQIKAG